jgi:hypothetical protein
MTTEKLFREVSVKKLYKDCILLARFVGQRVCVCMRVFSV